MVIKKNPDTEFVREMKRQLKDNGGYCPNQLEKNADTKCICKEFREQPDGICRCGLYLKEDE